MGRRASFSRLGLVSSLTVVSCLSSSWSLCLHHHHLLISYIQKKNDAMLGRLRRTEKILRKIDARRFCSAMRLRSCTHACKKIRQDEESSRILEDGKKLKAKQKRLIKSAEKKPFHHVHSYWGQFRPDRIETESIYSLMTGWKISTWNCFKTRTLERWSGWNLNIFNFLHNLRGILIF